MKPVPFRLQVNVESHPIIHNVYISNFPAAEPTQQPNMPLIESSCRHREYRITLCQGLRHRLKDHRWQLQFFNGQRRRVPDLGVQQFVHIGGFLV
jgi:hypothetical protein